MRILKIFFTALLILAALSVGGGLIAREVLLSMAVSQVRAAARELNTLQIDPKLAQSCLEYGGLPESGWSLVRTQLRFVSDTAFVLEGVCQNTESLRAIYRTSTLPPFVKKGLGQSGLVRGQDLSGLTLSVLGRTGVVYEESSIIHSSIQYKPDTPSLTLTDGPLTSCPGYGFKCCSETAQLGQGEQQPRALDCPRSCFAVCVNKPVIMSFQSDQDPAAETPVVQLFSGQSAEFFYTVSDIQGDQFSSALLREEAQQLTLGTRILRMMENIIKRQPTTDSLEKIVIAFGDGQTTEVSDLQGTVPHTYTCTRALCVYNATIQAVTRAGLTSTLTDVSKLQIHVRP